MTESTAVAAPSAASQTLELPRAGTQEYVDWRMTGKIPESKPKPADPAPADTGKDPEAAPGEPAAPKKQENTGRRKPDAEARIRELTEENRRLKEAAPKPAAEQPKPVQQQPQYTRPKPTVTGNGPDGKPYADYEAFVEDLSDWKAEQRIAADTRQRREQEATQSLQAKVEAARTRYGKEKLDEVIFPANQAIRDNPRIAIAIKGVIADSEIFPDLLYALGSDSAAFAEFIKLAETNPGKAIRYVARVETLAEQEMSKGNVSRGTSVDRDADGKFTSQAQSAAPAKRGPESAPAPPLEIGSRGAGPTDDTARTLSALEKGDPRAFRSFKKAEDAKELRRRRGA